jgi:hypothetical protein
MKAIIFFCLILLASCGPHPIRKTYTPVLPELPLAWEEILGYPHWRLEWVGQDGNWRSWEGKGRLPDLVMMQEWANPVLAWPFWPEKGINPGIMRPAGALFPWDVSGGCLNISWKAGIDANFWKELAKNSDLQKNSGTPRRPWLFDWPRFRELFAEETVGSEIFNDPWLADWAYIAQKTVESGFDRRRIKVQSKAKITVPCHNTFWAGSSPFTEPIGVSESAFVFMAGETPETWVSATGQLRINKKTWVFIPWAESNIYHE